MRLRHIEVFHAVYTSTSISSAAKLLNVSQPSVSKVLKHAEDQLGYQLFERVKGKLIPTQEAHRLYDEVAKVYAHLDSLKKLSENLGAKSEGVIRLASTPALGLSIVPRAVAEFHESHPHARFVLETLHLNEIIESLREGKIDIGMVFDPGSYPNISEYELASGEFLCLAPPTQQLPEGPKISLADVEGCPFIKLSGRGPLGRFLNGQFESSGLSLNTVAKVETYHMAMELVALGVGVSVVDEITARSQPNGNIQRRYLDPGLMFDVKALTLESEPVSLICHDFIDHMRRVMAAFLAEDLTS